MMQPLKTIGTSALVIQASVAALKNAAEDGIGHLERRSLRHTFRPWLDAVGTTVDVQQKIMPHVDIRTTMNIYGDVITDEMQEAASKVVGLAVNGL